MRVSVCIPAHDAARHLPAAIASALSQDVAGLEVVVVDDGSADATPAVLAGIRDERVRWMRLAERAGVATARNACLELARGEAVAWLDADDQLLPGSLAARLAALGARPGVALVHGACEVIDDEGRPIAGLRAPFGRDAVESSEAAFRELLCSNEVATSTATTRREGHPRFAPEVGRSSSDWDAWLRLARRGAVAYVARPLARYRRHAATISSETEPSGERLRCDARVVARALRGRGELRELASAALTAKALLYAGDAYTRGDRGGAAAAVADPALRAAIEAGDDVACERLTKAALAGLADPLDGTRFGAHVRALSARDERWSAELAHAAKVVARRTPADAVIAAIAKWDPALIASSGRAGCNLPDRALLPGGYPRDGAEAVAHLDALRRARGVTHVVVPATSGWWLQHYPELARRLRAPAYDDGRCAIYALGTA
jgi:glycosyltransferase involved in cell wall biosynthesis